MKNIYFSRNEMWAIEQVMNDQTLEPSAIRVFSDILRKMSKVNEDSQS